MSLIDEIRADREKGTPGALEACDPGDYSDFDGRSIVILGDDLRIAVIQGDGEEALANARRIARVPEYEDRILSDAEIIKAAEELANRVGFSENGWPHRPGWVLEALEAFREAVK